MTQYVIDPLAAFPKRWKDKRGALLTVMAGPVKGYLMVRYPGCAPFAISVGDLLNQSKRPDPRGPYEVVEGKKR
jgi:hypothetical protein